ncbi:hypothetical protein Tco_0583569 [Tanacetum coccineum]
MTPRSCLRWKLTGRIFKTVGLRCIIQSKARKSQSMVAEKADILETSAKVVSQKIKLLSGLDPQCQMTSDHNSSELRIHDHNNEPSSLKLVPKVSPLANKTATSRQELHSGGSYPIPAKVDSLPQAHAQTTMTYYKHQDLRIKKAQELKIKSSANSDINDLPQRYLDKDCQGILLASFQDGPKYEHVGQVTRSQGGKNDKDKQG